PDCGGSVGAAYGQIRRLRNSDLSRFRPRFRPPALSSPAQNVLQSTERLFDKSIHAFHCAVAIEHNLVRFPKSAPISKIQRAVHFRAPPTLPPGIVIRSP